MARPTRLYFPIEKVIYLLTRETIPGEGGDKKKFWREILGFDLPELVQEAILSSLDVEDLEFNHPSRHGDRYEAVSAVQGRINLSIGQTSMDSASRRDDGPICNRFSPEVRRLSDYAI